MPRWGSTSLLAGFVGNTASEEDEDGDENGSDHEKDVYDHDDIYIQFDSLTFNFFLPLGWLLYSLQFIPGKASCDSEARLPRPSSPVLLWQKAVQRQPNENLSDWINLHQLISWSLFYWWYVSNEKEMKFFLLFAGTRGCSSDLWNQDPEQELWLLTLF